MNYEQIVTKLHTLSPRSIIFKDVHYLTPEPGFFLMNEPDSVEKELDVDVGYFVKDVIFHNNLDCSLLKTIGSLNKGPRLSLADLFLCYEGLKLTESQKVLDFWSPLWMFLESMYFHATGSSLLHNSEATTVKVGGDKYGSFSYIPVLEVLSQLYLPQDGDEFVPFLTYTATRKKVYSVTGSNVRVLSLKLLTWYILDTCYDHSEAYNKRSQFSFFKQQVDFLFSGWKENQGWRWHKASREWYRMRFPRIGLLLDSDEKKISPFEKLLMILVDNVNLDVIMQRLSSHLKPSLRLLLEMGTASHLQLKVGERKYVKSGRSIRLPKKSDYYLVPIKMVSGDQEEE